MMIGSVYARKARKDAIERYGLNANASYIKVASEVILRENLYSDVPVIRDNAVKFMKAYAVAREYRRLRPIPDGFTRKQLGL